MNLNYSTYTPQRIAVKLKTKGERSVKREHPWIFEDSIEKITEHANTGDLAIIFSKKKNRLLAIGLFDEDSPIRIKVIHFSGSTPIDSNFWQVKISKAWNLRQSLITDKTNSYRWIYGESDGFPGMIVDVYSGVAVMKIYSAIWLPYLSEILDILFTRVPLDAIVLRFSRQLRSYIGSNSLEEGMVARGELANDEVTFLEHGLKLKTNVVKGHKTGFFLDHRHNRLRVGKYSAKKEVLDVFSYIGGFTVHALAGKAKTVTSIDISKQALKMAKENVALNGFKHQHQIMIGDAFEILTKLLQNNAKYDLVIIDPPSFAKKAEELPGALRSYRALVKLGAKLVRKGGILIMASCSSRINKNDFFTLVETELIKYTTFETLEKTDHDLDHPIGFAEAAYLKTGYYRIT